jgi:hypothetical protein
MKRIAICLALLFGCGGSEPAAKKPTVMLPPPDPTCGAHGVSVGGQCFCGAGYTGTACEIAPPAVSPETPCSSGAFFCAGAEVKQCGSDGKMGDAMTVQDCSTETIRTTCAPCSGGAAAACQSAAPDCAGSVYGLTASPVAFSDSGCATGVSCALTASQMTPTAPVVGNFSGMIPGIGSVTWGVYDMSLISSGVSFVLNDPTSQFQVNVAGCRAPVDTSNCAQGSVCTPPRPGSVRLTFGATTPGSPLTLDLEGPLSCNGTWKDVTVHVQTVWQ